MRLYYLISFFLALIIWQVISIIIGPTIIPDPVLTISTLVDNFYKGDLLPNLWDTFRRVMIGFFMAFTVGVLVGVGMGLRRLIDYLADYIVIILVAIPSLCWAVIGLFWFGLSDFAAYFVIAALAFPLIVLNTREGVKNLDKSLIEMATVFGAKGQKVITDVVLPSIFPYIFAGVRYGISLAWKVSVIAEILGMSSGVGYKLYFYYSFFRMDQVFAWTLVFLIMILLMDKIVIGSFERHFMIWRPIIAK